MPWYDSIKYTILCLIESTYPKENNGKPKRAIFTFLGFYLCLRFADVLKYTLNNYLDQSATYGVEI